MVRDKQAGWGGVIVVDSSEEEEEARTEEDKEVERIFKKGQEMKRKILIATVLLCQTCQTLYKIKQDYC